MAEVDELVALMKVRAEQIQALRSQLQLSAFDLANDPLGPIANLGGQLADDVLQLDRALQAAVLAARIQEPEDADR